MTSCFYRSFSLPPPSPFYSYVDVRLHPFLWVLFSKSFTSSSYTKPAVNTVYVIGDTRANRRWGGSTNYRSLEGGLGSSYVAYIFVFVGNTIICWLFKLSLSDQVQVILQLWVGPFRFGVKIFSWSACAVRPKKYFHCVPKSLLAALGDIGVWLTHWLTNQPTNQLTLQIHRAEYLRRIVPQVVHEFSTFCGTQSCITMLCPKSPNLFF